VKQGTGVFSPGKSCSLLNCSCINQVGRGCKYAVGINAGNALFLVVWIKFIFSDKFYSGLSSFDCQWTSVSALNIQKVRTIV
jgi:hypothetical protein